MMLIKLNKRIVSWLLIAIAILTLDFSFPQSATAIIQQQQEAPGQFLYSSRHKLQDEGGKTWQVILFKRVSNDRNTDINLRLVGFPQFEFIHPGDLTVEVSDEQIFTAGDRFAVKAPSPNVGEFDFNEILPQLLTKRSITLKLPLNNQQSSKITIPFPVILEWQEIAKS